MTRPGIVGLVLLAALAATSCGGSSDDGDPTTGARTGTTPDSATVMRDAVERALMENLAISRRALWTNTVPASARESTRGAALIEMKRSAAERRQEGMRVRVLEPRVKIEAVRLDPSYERATATVVLRDRSRVQERQRRPRVEQADERVRIQLRRVGDDPPHFVVWQVSGAR